MADERYDHAAIEKKWRERWQQQGTHSIDLDKATRPFYNLMMFPYPSAEGLHVGNVYAFTGSDIFGRFMRMRGYNVFEPIGFDAFGMHSENFALKRGVHPAEMVPRNIRRFRDEQLSLIGNMFDWSRAVDTTDSSYYKWTQWLFVQLFKAGLAYREEAIVNWCPSCKTVLASEQVVAGECERCATQVEQRKMLQWFFRITKYADELYVKLGEIDWSEITVSAQRNWIGKSTGAELTFTLDGLDESLTVFTTRPDTIYGATYMVLAPEHPLAARITSPGRRAEVDAYIAAATARSELERIEDAGKKTGVFTGGYAINPATGARIPVWVADYVLIGYGTGAIMAVPAHDTRDFAFARTFDLPIVEVISPDGASHVLDDAYIGEGVMVNSGHFDGIPSVEAKEKITAWLAEQGKGKIAVNFRLRDWCISRQRYWGPPIPIVHCPVCGPVPVPESDLPVLLPYMEDFKPDGSGKSPLARNRQFIETVCPFCGGPAERETDVMDNFLDSAWYFFRYPSTEFENRPFDPARTRKWLPVDMYIGGNEHAVLHLLYTRFITKVLRDLKYIDFGEPFKRFRAHGLIIKDGAKMSKSRGNVVNPDTFIERFGADCFRTYLMFLGPYTQGGDFQDRGITGVRRFYDRIWRLVGEGGLADGMPEDSSFTAVLHRTIRDVTANIGALEYNTAIAFMMELLNEITKRKPVHRAPVEVLVRLMAPFAPFLAEECWERLGHTPSVFYSTGEGILSKSFEAHGINPFGWPSYDESKIVFETFELVAMVNGKLRATMTAPSDITEAQAVEMVMADENVRRFTEGTTIRKTIYVPKKLVNIVAT